MESKPSLYLGRSYFCTFFARYIRRIPTTAARALEAFAPQFAPAVFAPLLTLTLAVRTWSVLENISPNLGGGKRLGGGPHCDQNSETATSKSLPLARMPMRWHSQSGFAGSSSGAASQRRLRIDSAKTEN